MKPLVVPILLLLACAAEGRAQMTDNAADSRPPSGVSPPPPSPPDVLARDGDGRVTIRAVRLAEPIRLDGILDEAAYTAVPSIGGFIQQEPEAGQPATERTEVWVFFDDRHLYVSARLWKSNPADLVANEMRKDDGGIFRNDSIGVVFDTFRDRRSGYYFNTNALGGVRDALLINENQNANLDFNPVWDVKSRQFDRGWTTEIAIPFQSLRYPPGRDQVWGFLVQRIDWRKNELSYLTAIPPSWGGAGIWKVSSAATLVGIEVPARAGSFELKPYVLSSVTTDNLATPPRSGDPSGDFGFDARYRLTRSMNADVTYNTDFAQVEADSQQLNLSRFSLFFPEKREFFLEMENTMSTGAASGPGGGRSANDPTPMLYFSRRIGLVNGVSVPVVAGGRLLGRAGEFTLGALSMRTGGAAGADAGGTTFSVARVRRNVMRQSAVGLLVTDRSASADGTGGNRVFAVDAPLRFGDNLQMNGYYAASDNSGPAGRGSSYQAQVVYGGDRYGAEVKRLSVSPTFDAGVGFVPRTGITRNFVSGRFSPRPGVRGIRKLSWEASLDRIAGVSDALETMQGRGVFRIQQSSGDEANLDVTLTDDRPDDRFTVAGALIDPGAYRFADVRANYVLGPQRIVAGTLSIARGGFYGGVKTDASYSGRVALSARLLVEPNVSWTSLRMPTGAFDAALVGMRTTVAMTPRTFVSSLFQYDSTASTLGANVRFRWEYQPGSDLYVVYTEGRDTRASNPRRPLNRSVTVKLTRLFRM